DDSVRILGGTKKTVSNLLSKAQQRGVVQREDRSSLIMERSKKRGSRPPQSLHTFHHLILLLGGYVWKKSNRSSSGHAMEGYKMPREIPLAG
ncbi:hypothetical protein ACC735_38585, partial [Rhizobium ruizarguesonis]